MVINVVLIAVIVCDDLFFVTLQIEVIMKFEDMCLESAKEFSPVFEKVCLPTLFWIIINYTRDFC